jgi:hypothetical protein
MGKILTNYVLTLPHVLYNRNTLAAIAVKCE